MTSGSSRPAAAPGTAEHPADEPSAGGEAEAGAILTVDLAAIRRNFRFLRDRAAAADCAAVVKADAYGLGADAIVPALQAEGCRTFFVAHWAEARALRRLLTPKSLIFVLNGVMPGAEETATADVLAATAAGVAFIPVLNSLDQAKAWSAQASSVGAPLPAALHADTGLSRLGFSNAEIDALLAAPDLLAGLDFRMLISHLACADEPESPVNGAQLAAFRRIRQRLPELPASFANSSGIFLGSNFHFDGVRAGAALYGVNPLPGLANPMAQAVRLEARVIQLRALQPGDAVGYGCDFVASRSLRAAVVGLGYGDGWPRRARTAAFLNGVRLPILGRVSMDTIIIDVSALAPGQPEPGSLVQFLCAAQTPDDVAAAVGTIGYEILTGLGRRPFRRYSDEG